MIPYFAKKCNPDFYKIFHAKATRKEGAPRKISARHVFYCPRVILHCGVAYYAILRNNKQQLNNKIDI